MPKDEKTPKIRFVREIKDRVIDKDTFRELTDQVLESNGVPRDYLFEYPYNEFESRKLIAKAEETVRKMANILNIRIEL